MRGRARRLEPAWLASPRCPPPREGGLRPLSPPASWEGGSWSSPAGLTDPPRARDEARRPPPRYFGCRVGVGFTSSSPKTPSHPRLWVVVAPAGFELTGCPRWPLTRNPPAAFSEKDFPRKSYHLPLAVVGSAGVPLCTMPGCASEPVRPELWSRDGAGCESGVCLTPV